MLFQEVEEEGDGMPEGSGDGEETQYHAVELSRGTRGFGFSIRGGREFQNMALFVLQIADNGPAAMDGRLQVMFISVINYLSLNQSCRIRKCELM